MPHNYPQDSCGCVDRHALIMVALCISEGSQWCLGMRPYEVGYATNHPIIGHQYNGGFTISADTDGTGFVCKVLLT